MKLSPVLRRVAVFAAIAIAVLSQTAAGQTKEQQAIREAGDKWQRDIAADNVDAIVALHTPDAVLMFSNAPLAKGSQAVRETYTDMVKLPGLVMHWIPTRIEVTSPTTATEYGTYTDSFDTPSGKIRDAGNYAVLWRQIDGKWRVAMGKSLETPAQGAFHAGDFVYRPPRQPHCAQSCGVTVVQITGNGPFQLTLGVPK